MQPVVGARFGAVGQAMRLKCASPAAANADRGDARDRGTSPHTRRTRRRTRRHAPSRSSGTPCSRPHPLATPRRFRLAARSPCRPRSRPARRPRASAPSNGATPRSTPHHPMPDAACVRGASPARERRLLAIHLRTHRQQPRRERCIRQRSRIDRDQRIHCTTQLRERRHRHRRRSDRHADLLRRLHERRPSPRVHTDESAGTASIETPRFARSSCGRNKNSIYLFQVQTSTRRSGHGAAASRPHHRRIAGAGAGARRRGSPTGAGPS